MGAPAFAASFAGALAAARRLDSVRPAGGCGKIWDGGVDLSSAAGTFG